MKEIVFLPSIIALIACAVVLLVFIPKYQIRGIQIESLLRENKRLKRDSNRYELIKAYGTSSKFLSLLSRFSVSEIDEFVLGRIKNLFRGLMAKIEGFLSIYIFVEALEGDMRVFMQKTFLEIFRERGTMHIASLLFNAITEKGQASKVELEKTLVDLGDVGFSRKVYCHVAELLKNHIEIVLGDIVDADFKTELKNELKRIGTLTV